MMVKVKAFTLIEIMIALFIFAIMAVMAATGLFAIIKSRDITEKHNARIVQLQTAMVIMQQDFQQLIDRPITDELGQPQPALWVTNNQIIFTRAGYVNPLGVYQRSNLQRVSYFVANNQLIRQTWLTLDRAAGDPPSLQRVLINNVDSMQIQILSRDQQTYSAWPPPQSAGMIAPLLPKSVEIILQLKNLGN